MSGGAALFANFRRADRSLSRGARLPGDQGPRRTCPCTCVSARCRFASSLRTRTHARSSPAAKALPAGCPSSSGASSTRKSSGIAPMSSERASGASTKASRSPTIRARFAAWCEGRTGYPIVDAAMRQLDTHRLHAQPPAHDRRVVPREGPARRLALGRALLRRHAPRLRPRLQQRRTGNGRPPPGATRNRTSASSTRSRNRSASIRTESSSAATCRSSRASATTRSMRRGSCPRATQEAKGVVVGRDYPAPIVDHGASRAAALALFKAVSPNRRTARCIAGISTPPLRAAMLRVLGGELLLQQRRRLLVVRQRHRPRALPAGHRLQSRGVAVELHERRETGHRERAGLQRLGARHLAAARRQIAGHVAHVVRRGS